MFGIDSPELLVIAIVALVVIGPKELPGLLRSWGKWMAQMRGMASEFRGHVDEMVRQSELDEVKKQLESAPGLDLQSLDPTKQIKSTSRKAWPRARRPWPRPRARSTIRWPSRNRHRRSRVEPHAEAAPRPKLNPRAEPARAGSCAEAACPKPTAATPSRPPRRRVEEQAGQGRGRRLGAN